MSNRKIETIDHLIDKLKRNVDAYRKSYRLCGNVNKAFHIVAGLIGCSAVLALVPAMPIFIAIAGAIPACITVL